MKIKYDDNNINKIVFSSLFVILLMFLGVYLEIKTKSIATILILGPIMLIVLIKIIKLLLYLNKNRTNIFLELKDDSINYQDYSGIRKIRISEIQDIQMDEDRVQIFMNANNKIEKDKKFFCYYVENLENVYQIPILGKKQDMELFLEKVKNKIKITHVKEDIELFSSLCGAYLFILVGVLWFFLFQGIWNCHLWQNLFKLLLLLMIEIFMHKYNKKSLSDNAFSFGLFFRCTFCSLTIAQYILCACQIESVLMKNGLEWVPSVQSVIIVLILYLLIESFYIPHNGLGKKLIIYMCKKEE